jgi:hypothetical protein
MPPVPNRIRSITSARSREMRILPRSCRGRVASRQDKRKKTSFLQQTGARGGEGGLPRRVHVRPLDGLVSSSAICTLCDALRTG